MLLKISNLLTSQTLKLLSVLTKSLINSGLSLNKCGPKTQKDQEFPNTPNNGGQVHVVWL